jgi:hypothetical protein
MQRQHISSTNLQSVGYDSTTQTLEIEFASGSIYDYAGVPKSEYQNLMNASSHGSYFHHNIRTSYPYRRVS